MPQSTVGTRSGLATPLPDSLTHGKDTRCPFHRKPSVRGGLSGRVRKISLSLRFEPQTNIKSTRISTMLSPRITTGWLLKETEIYLLS